jgi:hypothetical protein
MRSIDSRRKTCARGLPAAGAAFFTAVLLAASAPLSAGELRLFAASAPGPRYAVPVSEDDDALRLVDLEHSFPWAGGGSLDLGLVAADSPEAPKPPESAPEAVAPPPKKFWNTTTTLWTAAALFGGVGQAIGAPIKYGTNAWHFTDEKYFQYDTYAGGADKASHFIVSSGVSRLLYDVYTENGQPVEKSFWIAFATTLTAGIFVETGDAVTVYGWSWQDLSADLLGDLSGLLIHRYGLEDTIGLRLGPAGGDVPPSVVGSSVESLGSSYNDEIYTVDLKLGGVIRRLHGDPGIARFFLVSMAYYTRGFGYQPPLPARYQSLGVELGINFPAILDELKVPKDKWWGLGLYEFFNFFRIPYTQIGTYYNFKTQKWYGPSAPYHYY